MQFEGAIYFEIPRGGLRSSPTKFLQWVAFLSPTSIEPAIENATTATTSLSFPSCGAPIERHETKILGRGLVICWYCRTSRQQILRDVLHVWLDTSRVEGFIVPEVLQIYWVVLEVGLAAVSI